MTADDFVKIVRKGSDKLRVDRLVLKAGDQEYHGKGMLRISHEEFELDMTFDAEQRPPIRKSGVYTKSDYWKLSGVIEDTLQFKCDYVSGGSSQTLIVNPIELIPSGCDALSREEHDKIQEQLREINKAVIQNNEPEQPLATKQAMARLVYFTARIANYPLPTLLCKGTKIIEINPYFGERPHGRLDTIMGEAEGFEFAFIKANKEADLEIYLKSKEEYHSASEAEDWKKFYALMKALAFMLGAHAWPYRIEYSRNGQKITDRVTPTRRLARTVHAPFHLQNFDFQDVIKKATVFFDSNSTLSEEVAHILFLFREAADYEKVHGEITLISLCVLFESLVNQLFKELKLGEKALKEIPELQLFETAKSEIALHIEHLIVPKGKGYERLHGVVNKAQPFTARERFQAVVNHFCLQWKDDMEVVFRTWKKVRDPLVHGVGRANLPETEEKDLMLAESRIAGAINILVLKVIGYSGKMSASVFEEKYRQV